MIRFFFRSWFLSLILIFFLVVSLSCFYTALSASPMHSKAICRARNVFQFHTHHTSLSSLFVFFLVGWWRKAPKNTYTMEEEDAKENFCWNLMLVMCLKILSLVDQVLEVSHVHYVRICCGCSFYMIIFPMTSKKNLRTISSILHETFYWADFKKFLAVIFYVIFLICFANFGPLNC